LNEYAPPISWLLPNGPLTLAYYAMMIANFWLGWPFMALVATGALQSIPKDLYEAASIDGASGAQQFWNITVPLIRPAMIPAAVYGFTLSFNLFNFVYFMTNGGPARSTEILVTFAYSLVRDLRLYGAAAAFSVIVFFVALVIFLITNYITKATESYT
jgi:arabinogalactan oligomer/maltooligosaccharide transport system permease protein